MSRPPQLLWHPPLPGRALTNSRSQQLLCWQNVFQSGAKCLPIAQHKPRTSTGAFDTKRRRTLISKTTQTVCPHASPLKLGTFFATILLSVLTSDQQAFWAVMNPLFVGGFWKLHACLLSRNLICVSAAPAVVKWKIKAALVVFLYYASSVEIGYSFVQPTDYSYNSGINLHSDKFMIRGQQAASSPSFTA